MVPQDSLLIILVGLIDLIPIPPEPVRRKRGRAKTYPDRLFLKALVIMIVQQVHTPSGLLAILALPTAEMQMLRHELSLRDGRFACRRTWERRLAAIPGTLPAQIACLGCFLLELFGLWAKAASAAAIDSTVLIARGGVWHKRIVKQVSYHILRLTHRLIGQNPAGMAGSMAGNSISPSQQGVMSGYLWPPK